MSAHNGERVLYGSFMCIECNKVYNTKVDVIKLYRIHVDYKGYKIRRIKEGGAYLLESQASTSKARQFKTKDLAVRCVAIFTQTRKI